MPARFSGLWRFERPLRQEGFVNRIRCAVYDFVVGHRLGFLISHLHSLPDRKGRGHRRGFERVSYLRRGNQSGTLARAAGRRESDGNRRRERGGRWRALEARITPNMNWAIFRRRLLTRKPRLGEILSILEY